MQKIVAVKDMAMDAFMPLFVVPHLGLAVRGFRDECVKPGSNFAAHPGDFDLYELGEWDDASGKLVSHDTPKLVLRGSACKEAV